MLFKLKLPSFWRALIWFNWKKCINPQERMPWGSVMEGGQVNTRVLYYFLSFLKEGSRKLLQTRLQCIHHKVICYNSFLAKSVLKKEWELRVLPRYACVCGIISQWNDTMQYRIGNQKRVPIAQNGWIHWLNSKGNCSTISLILYVNKLVTLAGYYCLIPNQSVPPAQSNFLVNNHHW